MSQRIKETIRLSVEVEITYPEGHRSDAVAYASKGLYVYGCTNQPAEILAKTTGNNEEITLALVSKRKPKENIDQ